MSYQIDLSDGLKVELENEHKSSLYIDKDTTLQVIECRIDWDLVLNKTRTGIEGATVELDDIKVIVRRNELEDQAIHQHNEAPEHPIAQTEDIEQLDFSKRTGDWTTNLEGIINTAGKSYILTDEIKIKGVQIDFEL